MRRSIATSLTALLMLSACGSGSVAEPGAVDLAGSLAGGAVSDVHGDTVLASSAAETDAASASVEDVIDNTADVSEPGTDVVVNPATVATETITPTTVAPTTTVAKAPTTTAPTTTVAKAPTTTVAKAPTTTAPTTVGATSPEDALWEGPVEVVDNGVIDVRGVRRGLEWVEECGSFQDDTVRYWATYANGAFKTYRFVLGPEPANSNYTAGIMIDPFGNYLRNIIDITTDPAYPYIRCNAFEWNR